MSARDTTQEPTTWVIFAGVMMLLIGFLNFFYGLAAVVNDRSWWSEATGRSSPTSPPGAG